MGADRRAITEALGRLGSPQDSVACVLIGGTNGKGSTAAMIESIARAAGYRTGFFHSPALGPDQDHIQIGGRAIGRQSFIEAFFEADQAGQLTWFESLTAAAFLTFAAEQVDLAVIEVGMGGARDCTNVMTAPLASALVSVDVDHTSHLGIDLHKITREKCGIFRAERPAYLGFLKPEFEASARRQAQRIGALPISCRDRLLPVETHEIRPGLQSLTLRDPRPDGTDFCHDLTIELPLAGLHQAHNAALATLVAQGLAVESFGGINRAAVRQGLESCHWPGRLEWIPGHGRPILLDAAHNPAAVAALANYLDAFPPRSVDLIFAAFEDKDSAQMLKILGPWIRRLIVTTSGHGRSTTPQTLAVQWRLIAPGKAAMVAESMDHALEIANELGDGLLCITGSVDLVGKIRGQLVNST